MRRKSTIHLVRNKSLTLARILDDLLPIRGEQEISYHNDFLGLDGKLQTVRRFKDLYQEVNAMSCFLVEEVGLRRGQLVAICKTNDPQYFSWFLATIKAGGIAVPLHPILRLPELEKILSTCGTSILVTDHAVFNSTIRSRQALDIKHWIQADNEPTTMEGFHRISPHYLQAPPFTPIPLDPNDTVAIFHTSGTQGFPKGAMLSSRALLGGGAIAIAIAAFITKQDLALFTLPWAHIMAVSTALYGLMAGVPARFLNYFDVNQVIDTIERHKITMFIGVPAMFVKLVNAAPPRERLASIRLWVSSSDSLQPTYRRHLLRYGALFRLLGHRVVRPLFINAYGMVELGGIAMFGLDTPFLPGRGDLCIPVPPYRIRISDDKGRHLRRGQIGELLIKGPGTTSGYWEDPENTQSLFTSTGWLHTGDLGVQTFLGMVRLVGRKKDVIKCSGYSVYSKEVEEVLVSHPAVAKAAVVGVPHPQKGEAPIGIIELTEGSTLNEEDLVVWCRGQIAPYKAPRRIHIVEKGVLPQGMTEKVLKRVLRERYLNDFTEIPDK